MNVAEAKSELKRLLSRLRPAELTQLLGWMKNSDELEDELLGDNGGVLLQSIAEDLRANVPPDAMLPSETAAYSKMQRRSRPTVHVDSFLYDDEQVDSQCERGLMSRNYCLSCGSHRTAPLDFISHSFSVTELRFLFQHVLPDLSGRTLVDVGSRLGAVLYGVRGQHTHTHTHCCCRVFVPVEDIRTTVLLPDKWSCADVQGYVYSSASRLLGLEISEAFVRLQDSMLHKYKLTDRVQVLQADVCTQDILLQNADVVVMNNVFEYFLEPEQQVRAWKFIMQNFRKKGSLLVTVPSLHESLDPLQEVLQPDWVEELPVNYDVYLGRDTDPDALRQIHLYRVI